MEDSEYNFFYLIRALMLPLRFLLLVKIMYVFFHSLSPVVHMVVHFWFLFWLRMPWIHCHHCRQESAGCDGGGATGLIVMTYAVPQSDSVFLLVSRSLGIAYLLSISC